MPTIPSALAQIITDTQGNNLDFRMLGCKVDGATDDTVLAQAIIDTVANLGVGAPVMLPGDAPMIVSGLTLPTGTVIVSRGYGCIKQKAASAVTNVPFVTTAASALPPWSATTAWALNALIIDPNGNVQLCTTPGTSGGSIPTFSTSGVTSDGSTLKWTYQSAAGNILLEGLTFDGDSVNQSGVSGAHLIHLINASNVQIRNCDFRNSTGRCVTGYGLDNVRIDGGNYINWQPGNNAAIQFWASEGRPITNLKIRGVTVDGRPSVSSCIKLNGAIPDPRYPSWTNNWPISQIYIGDGVVCYTAPGLVGVELWSDKQYSYTDFVLNGIQVHGAGATSNDFGISCGGSGGARGVVSNFQIDNCALGLEISSGQDISAGPGTITAAGAGASFIDCNFGSGRNCTLQGVTFEALQGVGLSAANFDGLGPYSAADISIVGCKFYIPTSWIGISILANAAGAAISKVQIIGCSFTGAPGSSANKGVVIDPTAGTTIDGVTVALCKFDNLTNGVLIQSNDTNGRYIYNDFTSVGAAYNNTAIPTDAFVSAGSAGPGILIGGAGTGSPIVEFQNTSLGNQTEVLFEFLGNNDPAMTMFDHTLTRMVQLRWDSGSISFVNAPFVAAAAARWLTGALEAAGVFSVSAAADGSGSLFLKSASSAIGTFLPGTNASGPAIINSGLNVVDGFGCNGQSAQAPVASGGAISPASVPTTASTQTTPYGFTASAQFDDLIAAVNSLLTGYNAMRAALVANGVMS